MKQNHINISDLTVILKEKSNLAVKFQFDGTTINPGYHVTEVRHASVRSRDCGKMSNVEQWNEITIQLLNGSSKSLQGYMPGSKLLGIVRSALESFEAEAAPYLFFEFAPDNGPIRKLRIESVEYTDEVILVMLGSERPVCKPFKRAIATGLAADKMTSQSSPDICCADTKGADRRSCCG